MLSGMLKAFLIPSFLGSLLAIVITLLKPVTKRIFGYLWHYYIWLTVLFVMILPVRFTLPQGNTDIPLMNTQTVKTDQIMPQPSIVNAGQNVNTEYTITAAQKATDFISMIIANHMNYFSIIWLLGIAICFLINISGYIRLIVKTYKNSVVVSCPETLNYTNRKITVRAGRDLSSPFMLGVFRPTLVLPDKELSAQQLNNILLHEMTHFHRKDILYKWFMLLVRLVHWFNPIVYYVARQINNECEISCDLSVVSCMNRDEQMSYINTILSLVSGDRVKQIPLTMQMASDKGALKRRFTMIKNIKKTSKLMSVISAVIAVVMLSTTVFASGIVSDLTADKYIIQITENNKKLDFYNKPYFNNEVIFLPMRETLEKLGIIDGNSNKIEWNNGNIMIIVGDQSIGLTIGSEVMKINPLGADAGYISASADVVNTPILRGNVTYIPFEYIDYITSILGHKKCNLEGCVWDTAKGNTKREPDYKEKFFYYDIFLSSDGEESVKQEGFSN